MLPPDMTHVERPLPESERTKKFTAARAAKLRRLAMKACGRRPRCFG